MCKLWDVVVQEKQSFVIGAWNRVVSHYFNDKVTSWEDEKTSIEEPFDGFIGLCDDVELSKNALENAVMSHRYHFPDGDGVIGFNQDCPGHSEYTVKWFGQTLMGRKFIERYKSVDYQICCPDYKHFYQDEEMYEYAMSLGKFHCEPMALMHHYHPSFIADERDNTHNIIRVGDQSPRSHDMEMQVKRKHLGLLWGQNFNLLGGN